MRLGPICDLSHYEELKLRWKHHYEQWFVQYCFVVNYVLEANPYRLQSYFQEVTVMTTFTYACLLECIKSIWDFVVKSKSRVETGKVWNTQLQAYVELNHLISPTQWSWNIGSARLHAIQAVVWKLLIYMYLLQWKSRGTAFSIHQMFAWLI